MSRPHGPHFDVRPPPPPARRTDNPYGVGYEGERSTHGCRVGRCSYLRTCAIPRRTVPARLIISGYANHCYSCRPLTWTHCIFQMLETRFTCMRGRWAPATLPLDVVASWIAIAIQRCCRCYYGSCCSRFYSHTHSGPGRLHMLLNVLSAGHG